MPQLRDKLPPGASFFEALKQALMQPRRSAYTRFCILRGPEDFATLMKLRGTGPLKESQRKIDKFLRDRAKKAVKDVKHWLGIRRGRIPDVSKQKALEFAASLRERNPKRFT
jgi:hypothetical protein